MARDHDWDIFADESPTQIHHKDCQDTPESHPTGDATAEVVLDPGAYADGGEEFDVSCACLDALLGSDRHDDEPMRRTPGVSYEPEDGADVLDFVADYGYDAIDAGVGADAVVTALEEAAEEIQRQEVDA